MKYQVMLMSQTSVNTIMVQKSLKTIHSTHQNQYACFLILRSSFFHFLVPNFLRNIEIAITHIFKELFFKQDAAVTFLSRYFNHKRHITWIDVVWTPILGRNFTS